MALPATEFIRRMLLHVLPPGFHRIRYYRFSPIAPGNASEAHRVPAVDARAAATTRRAPAGQTATDYRDHYEALTGRSLRQCPPVSRGEHARRRPPRQRDGLSGHPGFVVTSPSMTDR